jgi:hypothetical protein
MIYNTRNMVLVFVLGSICGAISYLEPADLMAEEKRNSETFQDST